MTSRSQPLICPGPACLRGKRSRGLGLRIHLNFGAQPAGRKNAAGRFQGITGNIATEVGSPSLNGSAIGVDPVESPLSVNVLPFHGANADLKKNVLAVLAPVDVVFDCLVMSQMTGRTVR